MVDNSYSDQWWWWTLFCCIIVVDQVKEQVLVEKLWTPFVWCTSELILLHKYKKKSQLVDPSTLHLIFIRMAVYHSKTTFTAFLLDGGRITQTGGKRRSNYFLAFFFLFFYTSEPLTAVWEHMKLDFNRKVLGIIVVVLLEQNERCTCIYAFPSTRRAI